MKTLSAALAAALIAGSCSIAFAQGGGSGGGGGDTSTKPGMNDPDKNPTGAMANPKAGNTAAAPTMDKKGTTGMSNAPVAGTPKTPEPTKSGGAVK